MVLFSLVVFDGGAAKVTIGIPMSDADLLDEQLRLLMRATQAGDANAYRALLTAITPRVRRIVRAECELRTEHRRQTERACRLCEPHDAVEAIVIGERERREPEARGLLGQLLGMTRAVEEREIRMAVQLRIHDYSL